jgi:hypothetical protein
LTLPKRELRLAGHAKVVMVIASQRPTQPRPRR